LQSVPHVEAPPRPVSTLEYLDRWKNANLISLDQHETLARLVRKDRLSVFVELNALLYAGVVAFIAGVGWTIQTYFASLGDAAVLSSLAALFAACLFYCFTRSAPYSHEAQESQYFAFDYVLYLGCLCLGVALGYLEFRFHILKHNWDQYLLLSATVYFVLSYRFDNRLVLSLALSSLAGWFGLRAGVHGALFGRVVDTHSLRPYAFAYGSVVAVAGAVLHRAGIKRHFFETYLHVAMNVLLLAALSGVVEREHEWLYLMVLCVLAGLTIVQGIRTRRFAFVAYATLYAYAGISAEVLRDLRQDIAVYGYVAVSGAMVLAGLVTLARRFGKVE
jgi:hypothetical protein